MRVKRGRSWLNSNDRLGRRGKRLEEGEFGLQLGRRCLELEALERQFERFATGLCDGGEQAAA